MSIYVELSTAFNARGTCAILGGGQAVVLHNLAIMSKDGDWILKEDDATCQHVLGVLAAYGARYRFGAPLDVRWLAGGWSAHLEFMHKGIRVRTDFVTRPPRLSDEQQQQLWRYAASTVPFAPAPALADMKKTVREKDYAVIGELARLMDNPRDQLIYSRSAQDLIAISNEHPALVDVLIRERPLLAFIRKGRDALEAELDAERRRFMRADEHRLERYMTAAEPFAATWTETSGLLDPHDLRVAHATMVARALQVLPFHVEGVE